MFVPRSLSHPSNLSRLQTRQVAQQPLEYITVLLSHSVDEGRTSLVEARTSIERSDREGLPLRTGADAGCRLVTSAAAVTFVGVQPSSRRCRMGDGRMRKKPLELL